MCQFVPSNENIISFFNEILVVIVLYNTDLCESQTFITLSHAISTYNLDTQVSLFVQDNSAVINYHSRNIKSNIWKIEYYNDIKNSGISVSYNKAADYAKINGKKFLLLLDQDTSFSNEIFNFYHSAIMSNRHIFLFVPIIKLSSGVNLSPFKTILKRGIHINVSQGENLFNKLSVINSGIFVYVDIFLDVGGYNDKVTLDFSDYEFISRYKKKYPNFFVINDIALQNFSDHESNLTKLKIRFRHYCNGAKNCTKNNIFDNLSFAITCIIRTTTLTIRTKSFSFIRIFIKEYLLS